MPLPTTFTQSYTALVTDIEQGNIQIPRFQRDFVWSVPQTARLMDSLIKGYPIGAFIFWQTKEQLRVVKNLGGSDFPMPPEGEFVSYVLDGQQRLTSIYACMKGAKIETEDYSQIFVDLESSVEDGDDVVVLENKPSCIKITDLAGDNFNMLADFDKKYPNKVGGYLNNLRNYNFPITQYKDTDISVATEIFTRINVGGKSLNTFEIMVAKTYDARREFDLGEKFEVLRDELGGVDYETIPGETVLQAASVILRKDCRRKTILDLPKDEFIDGWDGVIGALKYAIDYFRKEYRIPVSRLLPYNALLVPFTYFFHKNGNQRPDAGTRDMLCDFFWRNALSERYSGAVESNLGQDIKKMEDIYGGKLPSYEEDLHFSPEWVLDNGYFSVSRSFVKAILCLYAHFEPQSFDSGAKVTIGNDYLQRANSKNYHHFFPSAYLEKHDSTDWGTHMINHVVNITIVDESLNKGEIGAKKPSVYMKKFQKDNPKMDATMRTHLIDNLEEFGVLSDDYGTFCRKRAERISEEIQKRIIKKK